VEMKVNPNDIDIFVLRNGDYKKLSDMVDGISECDDFAFTILGTEKPKIILNEKIEFFPPYVHKAVIAHELAHIHGVIDEEDADKWALEYLDNGDSKKFLIDNWELRHGKEYKDEEKRIY